MTHYYSQKQTSQTNEQQITVRLLSYEFQFLTASGLFSKDHLDSATKLLIETVHKHLQQNKHLGELTESIDFDEGEIIPVDEEKPIATKSIEEHRANKYNNDHPDSQSPDQQTTVVDLGCGWGVVGIILKRLHPHLNITSLDISERAVEYTKKNAKKNKADITILHSNIFQHVNDPINFIVTNPPYSAGRDICFQFIEDSQRQLADNGNFFLVARHQKGGKALEKHMEETFGNVQTLAKSGGFRVYCSTKN